MGEMLDTSSQLPDGGPTRPVKRSRIGERTMLACVACKHRKLKCDGGSPKCETCIKTGRECLVEDPATGLHRPRNYMPALESRVNYLETLLRQLHPEIDIGGVSPSDDDDLMNLEAIASNGLDPPPSIGSHLQPDDRSSVDHLSSEVALLCLSAAGQEPRYFGPSSAVSFSHIASQIMGLEKGSAGRHLRRQSIRTAKAAMTPASLQEFPSEEEAARLTSSYFHNLHPQFPFLHRPTCRKWETECRVMRKSKDFSKTNPVATFFTLMIYAIGSLGCEMSNHADAEKYYTAALQHLEPVLDLDGLESIQALLSIAVYSVRSPSGVSLWRVSGMAMRHCIELGYHRSTEMYRRSKDLLTVEMTKRCFWVAYDFDRYVSCILGLPGAISDLSIDAELPLDVNDEDLTATSVPQVVGGTSPTTMTGAIHVIKLRQIWSKFSAHLFPTSARCNMNIHSDDGPSIEELRQELEEWRASAPMNTEQSSGSPLSVFASHGWFQLAYDHSILLLYRHYILDTKPYRCHPPLPKTPEIINRAFEECYAKAKDLCLTYRRLYQNPTIQFTWGSLHMLFFGGLTYLFCLWRSKSIRDAARQRDVINTCMACQTVLVIVAERWKLATSYRDLFETLSQRTISMMCGDLDSNAGVGQTDVQGAESALPMQDWSTEFDGLEFPPDSEWLVSELVQGVQEVNPGEFFDFANVGLGYDFEAGGLDFGQDWNASTL